jgi:hypothetical protein
MFSALAAVRRRQFPTTYGWRMHVGEGTPGATEDAERLGLLPR